MSPVPRALAIELCHKTGRAVIVHVSTFFPAQQSHSDAQDDPEGRVDTHSPLVAVTTMVSTLTTSVCGPLTILSVLPRPTVTTGICLMRQVVLSAGMEALMQHYQAATFLKEVSMLAAAPRRPSTNRMHDDRRLRFTNWGTGHGFGQLGPTAAEIATFLYGLFDTSGLSPQTIKKKFRSCLASVWPHRHCSSSPG